MDRSEAEAALDQLAPDIVARLEAAEKYAKRAAKADKKADDLRLSAALHVAKARHICEDAGIGWRAWSTKHLGGRSYTDIKRLVRIGSAEDPAGALADERRRARDSMQRSRQQQRGAIASNDSPMPWIERSLTRLQDAEVRRLIGLLVSRLPVEDLEKMRHGLLTIIEKRTGDDA